MNLVNDQNDVAGLLNLIDQALHAALKLAAELGTSHHSGHIQHIDLFVQQLVGHIAVCNPLGQALGNGGFTNAGLTDQAGIVLLAAVENLDHALRLRFSAHHPVNFALLGLPGQVQAIRLQELPAVLLSALFRLFAILGRLGLLPVHIAGELAEERERSGSAVLFFVGSTVVGGDHLLAAQGSHHFTGEILQVLVGNAQLLHHVIHRLDAQLFGAFQAEALVFRLAVFNLCDKNHRVILFASAA